MSTPSSRRGRSAVVGAAGVALMALAALVAGCGSKHEDDTSIVTGYTMPPETTASTASDAARQPCTEANLAAAVQADYPGATVTSPRCSTQWAVAGIRAAKLKSGVGVGFFTVGSSGAWELVNVVGVDADLAASAPPGFVLDLLKSFAPPQSTTTTVPQVTEVTWTPSAEAGADGNWSAQAVVRAVSSGQPVSGTFVEGTVTVVDPAGGPARALSCTIDATGTCTIRATLNAGAKLVHLSVDKVTANPPAAPFTLAVDIARP